MNKILIILILILSGVGILGFAGYMIWMNGLTTPPTNTVPNPSGGPPTGVIPPITQPGGPTSGTPSTNSDAMTITNDNGGGIVVKNIKKDPQLKSDTANPGYYHFANASSSTAPYSITYIDSTQYFIISINEEPIGAVREEMQKYLAERLGIPVIDLCYLNYMVSVPYAVNKDFSSIDLRFSMCGDAVPL